MFTRPVGPDLHAHVVLNALRHQWNVHNAWLDGVIEAVECSTPYGINGMFTAILIAAIMLPLLCSTPYGINGMFTA